MLAIFFGMIDILAGILVFMNSELVGISIAVILGSFLLFKGITTIFPVLPVWIGPIFILAGIVDAIVGFFLYAFAPGFTILTTTIGVLLMLKGAWTLLAPII